MAVVHESPFRVTELAEAICEELPEAELSVSCDLTKLHEKTLRGSPEEVLADNFSYAIIYGVDGMDYKSPEIIREICEYLKK